MYDCSAWSRAPFASAGIWIPGMPIKQNASARRGDPPQPVSSPGAAWDLIFLRRTTTLHPCGAVIWAKAAILHAAGAEAWPQHGLAVESLARPQFAIGGQPTTAATARSRPGVRCHDGTTLPSAGRLEAAAPVGCRPPTCQTPWANRAKLELVRWIAALYNEGRTSVAFATGSASGRFCGPMGEALAGAGG